MDWPLTQMVGRPSGVRGPHVASYGPQAGLLANRQNGQGRPNIGSTPGGSLGWGRERKKIFLLCRLSAEVRMLEIGLFVRRESKEVQHVSLARSNISLEDTAVERRKKYYLNQGLSRYEQR
ncbi:unnamed protein product [Arabis nemorensis]|uniref:Uncharacterized protein n=1 Tax=Arabis nemorensis TaxID=586526 RepID=A0A565CP72_9BRAS|nr:unnamed protein product [Arabis nemorensis]